MDKSVALVVHGFINLSPSDQRECYRYINEYYGGTHQTKISLSRRASNDAMQVDMGPLTGGCPCCGK